MKICGACNTENDDTRVFCLNCAQRLPPPVPGSKPGLPVNPSESAGVSAPQIYKHQAAKGPAKLRQAGTRFSTIVFRFFLLLMLGAVCFGTYLTLQPPAEIPPTAPPASSQDIAQMLTFLRTAAQSPGGAWQLDEKSLNQFLASAVSLRSAENPLGLKVQFQRCYASLGEGSLDFTMQTAVFERTLYFRVAFAPDSQGGKLGARVVDASIGQLQIPGVIAQFLLPLWEPCFKALGPTLELFDGAKSAEVTPKRIVVRWPEKSSR